DVLSAGDSSLRGPELFARARRQTTWHYQWVVLWDYLVRICGVDEIRSRLDTRAGSRPRIRHFATGDHIFMPVEFSAAAFRFAHSIIRPYYLLNQELIGPPPGGSERRYGRIPVFDSDKKQPSLAGRRTVPTGWTVEWDLFFPFAPSPIRRIPGVEKATEESWY